MKTVLGWVFFLSIIALPIYRYFLDWQSSCIKETFENEFQLYGVSSNFNYGQSFKLNQDYWKHNRVAYLPFIYRKKSVYIRRYVCTGQYRLHRKIQTYTYHGDINIIL